MSYIPGYIELCKTGDLKRRIEALNDILKECKLCPRECGVNRMEGEIGVCKSGADLMVSSVSPHFGEEPPLVGFHGSGTIFLTHCNLRCVFCQNYDISHIGRGHITTSSEMANYMLRLQKMGCHNINFVTPTHYLPQIVASLPEAIDSGLKVPLVFNCGGYESLEVIRLLQGIIDIYMPDVKYADGRVAKKYSMSPDYPDVIKKVLLEMYRQVGNLKTNQDGIVERGLLIRHLIIPENLAGTEALMEFIATDISKDSYVNIMAQYRPMYRADEFPELNRKITVQEYQEAIAIAIRAGLHRGF
ncbi:MAG: radical SAM protein [Deltaproteobacteria bacterium CG12_big_fil_rev_8_21_14_0_65_43_10]|nr:MAG: radical SAM protein [Deltaproteobacteria bacterium CG12_big_fil_rev_8_21_14_0_65_43_10]PIZ19063.1 MAG: radical SAM protein [Deltaproteobacteria bacterium CG_4_10_14_0_8_um_filter_43_12]